MQSCGVLANIMTAKKMPETILKMLEDKDSDNDEVNARIWCFVNKYTIEILDIWEHGEFTVKERDGHFDIGEVPKGTTSLDAAMSIGAEELEGWMIDNIQEYADNTFRVILRKMLSTSTVESGFLINLARAICHARIQALAYVRGL